ncbi:MAG: ferritin-like domain-containing protein [Orrella sp.]
MTLSPQPQTMDPRQTALAALLCGDVDQKCQAVDQIDLDQAADVTIEFAEPAPLPHSPGRPQKPSLVSPSALKLRRVSTPEGRAVLLHALAHIEFNAINLALDIVWRFAGQPVAFYRDWLQVAKEESMHFQLLRGRLAALGYDYGDFVAHNGLWEMAHKTAGDLLARLALVPRTLEARGLDASLPIRRKLAHAGDEQSAQVLDVILRDEIGHVGIGNQWYRHVCSVRGLDPYNTYDQLAAQYDAPTLRGPFNWEARRQAGFDERELARLAG